MFFSSAELPAEQPKFKFNVFFLKILSTAWRIVFFLGKMPENLNIFIQLNSHRRRNVFLGLPSPPKRKSSVFFLASWPGNLFFGSSILLTLTSFFFTFFGYYLIVDSCHCTGIFSFSFLCILDCSLMLMMMMSLYNSLYNSLSLFPFAITWIFFPFSHFERSVLLKI